LNKGQETTKERKEAKERESLLVLFSSSALRSSSSLFRYAASLLGRAKKNASTPTRVRAGPSAGGGASKTL